MLQVESSIKSINKPSFMVYKVLSDFNNFTNFIPKDKVKNWEATEDSCSFDVSMLGRVTLRIIEREENKMIKITGDDNKPFEFNFWVQLVDKEGMDTKMKLTLHIALNPMMKMMLKSKIESGIEQVAEQIANSFNKI